ncbi:hypothetical protein ANCCAN_28916 [Ancylostoma caninum]|uniref:Uncharacterized protein n=1 Tax=Ancylostoma caninum TaxID=29170 RepID=A0A368EZY1_ANCCA|nr:hypothetical protein ANCCAN_28916 [Ancylostoma caninum]
MRSPNEYHVIDTLHCSVDVQTFKIIISDCNAWCPSVYSDDCNGNMPPVCATSAQAADMVSPAGTECRETWMCPAGTMPFYYTTADPAGQAYPAGDFARCFPPPNNFYYLPDGVTRITGLACQG